MTPVTVCRYAKDKSQNIDLPVRQLPTLLPKVSFWSYDGLVVGPSKYPVRHNELLHPGPDAPLMKIPYD